MAERQHTTGKARGHSKSGEHRSKSSTLPADPIERLADLMGMESAPKPAHLTEGAHDALAREASERLRKRVAALAGSFQEVDSSSLQKISDLLGGDRILGSAVKSELDAHELLHRGLPRAALSSLVDKLHIIGVGDASKALGMSLRTLQRHKNTPVVHLDVQQSGRAWKFAEILAKATRVLGSQDEAEQWLSHPAIGLDQKRPIDLLTTPAGVNLVEDYLGRLEYDVYT
jgi:putative toxin-antitoxin system antitoxin component (TIGR02293 family)